VNGPTRQQGGPTPKGAGGARRLGIIAVAAALLLPFAGHAEDELEVARAAIARQDYQAAIAVLQGDHRRPSASAEANYLFGLALKGTGQADAAMVAFQRALEQRPKYVEALLAAGSLYLESGQFAAAEAAFAKGLEQNPKSPSAFYYGLGRVKMETDSLRSARVWLLRGTAAEEGNPTFHKALGDVYARLGTAGLALDEYRRALEYGLASPAEVHHAIGKVYSRQRQWPEAMEAWHKALAADSSFAPAYSDLASLYLAQDPPQHYDEAVPLLRRLAEMQPDDRALAAKLARVMAQSSSYSTEALPLLETAAAQSPGDIKLQLLIGRLSWRKADYARALQAYRQAAQLDPEHAGVLEGLAEAQKATGDTAAAIATLQQLASLDTCGREDVAGALGVLLFEQGRYAEAIPHLQQKLKASPSVPLLYRLLGLCYIKEENYAAVMVEVKPALDRAVAAYPDERRLGVEYVVLGTELYSAGRFSEAVALFQQRLEQDPANASVHLNIGFAYFVQKEYGKALAAFRRAAQYQPDNAQVYIYQGACYRLTGDEEQAMDSFLEAARLDPHNPEALKQAGLSLLLKAQSLQKAADHEQSQRQAVQAVGYLQRAVATRGDVQAHLWLAQGYALSKQLEKAKEEFNRVLKMDPDNPEARSGLDRVQGSS
jgi:tetratricopeptide (TPR) repeat protein